MTEIEKESIRYNWLLNEGYKYHEAIKSTGSQSVGTGPYILLEVPSFNGSTLTFKDKEILNAIIDEAIEKKKTKELQDYMVCKKCNLNRGETACFYPHDCQFTGVLYGK